MNSGSHSHQSVVIPFPVQSTPSLPVLADADLRAILGVADRLIATAGRTTLMMALRGSKAQRVMQHDVASARGYGYYAGVPEKEVMARIDGLIAGKLLRICYHDGFPLLAYTEQGLMRARRYAAEDWLDVLRARVGPVAAGAALDLPFLMSVSPQRNLDTLQLVVTHVAQVADKSWLPLLLTWQKAETKRVRGWLTPIISALEKT